jgi:hypothetical protein
MEKITDPYWQSVANRADGVGPPDELDRDPEPTCPECGAPTEGGHSSGFAGEGLGWEHCTKCEWSWAEHGEVTP